MPLRVRPSFNHMLQIHSRTAALHGCNMSAIRTATVATDGGYSLYLYSARNAPEPPGIYQSCLRSVSYFNIAPPEQQVMGKRLVRYTVWAAAPEPPTGASAVHPRPLLSGSGHDAVLMVEPPRYDCWLYCAGSFRQESRPNQGGSHDGEGPSRLRQR